MQPSARAISTLAELLGTTHECGEAVRIFGRVCLCVCVSLCSNCWKPRPRKFTLVCVTHICRIFRPTLYIKVKVKVRSKKRVRERKLCLSRLYRCWIKQSIGLSRHALVCAWDTRVHYTPYTPLWPALRYGIGYQTVWEIRPSADSFKRSLKTFFIFSLLVYIAHFWTMRSTNLLTYLLTHLLTYLLTLYLPNELSLMKVV